MDIVSTQQKIKEKSAQLKTLQDELKQQGVKKSLSTLRIESSQLLNQIADVKIKIGMKNDQMNNQSVSFFYYPSIILDKLIIK